ncbi:MAG TPA: ASKHA domain-containing protein [Candidatus Latescibacteria bacterium]|nr:ASKHA domain-containing protein [Candidatus Latescibacterota bacterium]
MPNCRFNDQVLPIVVGKTLFEHADTNPAIRVPSSCNRVGTCHECIVQVHEGIEALTPRTDSEQFLSGNYRLACQAKVIRDDMDINVSTLKRKPKILTASEVLDVPLDPLTRRSGDRVVRGNDDIDAFDGEVLGLAIDVGTTTVVAQLVDLTNGKRKLTAAFENPQIFGGSNVLHRINYANDDPDHELQRVLIGHLNGELRRMGKRRHIYEAVVTGNPTMRDLFFGLDVHSIGVKPFKSITEHEMLRGERAGTWLNASPRDLGLFMNGRGLVYGAPLIACHVGADTAAGVLATRLFERERPSMLVDMGTNTEVVVGNKHRLIAASCPAGPAFEGSGLRCGMPGLEGAVESFRLEDGNPVYSVIGDVTPRGICGSGVVDILAELTRNGIVDTVGRFVDGRTEFVIDGEQNIAVDRQDLSQLAQAKAANYAGQQILLRTFGIDWDDLEFLFFSGGFANYLNVPNAQAIGLIPPIDPAKVMKVGNTALEGAAQMLINKGLRERIEQVVLTIEHIELEREPDFFDMYVEGCLLEPMGRLKG